MKTLEALLEAVATKASASYEDIRAIVADRKIAGVDVVEALRAQQDLRRDEMALLLDTARKAERELLASESRAFERAQRDCDRIGELITDVERRESYKVPAIVVNGDKRSQVEPELRDAVTLTKDQSMRSWVQARGERPTQSRLGRIITAMATGSRRGLNPDEIRDMSEGTDSAGGFTVPAPLAAAFIDRLRNAAQVMRAGATVVPMSSETLSIARLASGYTTNGSPVSVGPQWKIENDPIDSGDVTLERVLFQARTLPVLLRMSVELAEDSVNIDQIIERELSAALALELDRAALLGTGTVEPKGLAHQSGVASTSWGGTVPTSYDPIVASIARLWEANVSPNAYLYSGRLAGAFAGLKEPVQYQPLRKPEAVAALQDYRTNQIPTSGSPHTSDIYCGYYPDLLIGMRTGFRLEVSREAAGSFSHLQIAVRAYLRADVQVAHAESFDITTDIGC